MFRFNGSDLETNKFEVHKDPTEAYANVNVPVYNCTHETRTIWVEPIGEEVESWEYRAGSKLDKNQNETFSNHLRSEYREIETQYITRSISTRADELSSQAKSLNHLNGIASKLSNLSLQLYSTILKTGYVKNAAEAETVTTYFVVLHSYIINIL